MRKKLITVFFICSLLGCSLVRNTASRSPASVADDALSNDTLVEIPSNCILADSRKIIGDSKMSLYYANKETWVSSNALQERVASRFVVIKAECEKLLTEKANAIVEKYFIEGAKNEPFLPYTASSKRPYCGLEVTEEACSATIVAHPSYIFDTRKNVFPQDVETNVKWLTQSIAKGRKIDLWNMDSNYTFVAVAFSKQPKSNFVMHFVDDNSNALVARGDVRFLILDKRESAIRRDSKKKTRHTDDWDLMEQFYSGQVDLTESPDFARFLKVQAKQWDQEHNVEKWKIFREGRYGALLAQEITKRARLLALVWKNSKKPDDEFSTTSLKLNLVDAFADAFAKRVFADVSEKDWKRFNLDDLIPELTQAAVQYASQYLSKSDDPEFITMAAAIWWASRSIQLSAGCDLTTETPIREDLVRIQFDHQSCRRSYTGRAYIALNRSIALSGNIPIESPYWAIAIALGSRIERARLFNVAVTDASKRLIAQQTASSSEVWQFLWQLIVSNYELQKKKVLTWNGFQPASEKDLDTLKKHVENLKSYFKQVSEVAHRNRWNDPALVAAMDEVRAAWKDIYPDKVNELQASELGATFEEELEGLTKSLEKVSSRQSLAKLFDMSKVLLSEHGDRDSETCKPWLLFLDNQKNRQLFLEILKERDLQPSPLSTCLDLLPYWASLTNKESSKFERLEEACNNYADTHRSSGLSCISLALLAKHQSPERATWLVKGLLDKNIPGPLYPQAFYKFSDELEEVLKRKKTTRSNKLAWLEAASDLAAGVSEEVMTWLKSASPIEEFAECYDPKQLSESLEKSDFYRTQADIKINRKCQINESIAKKWFQRFVKLQGAFSEDVSPWLKPAQLTDYANAYCSMEWRFKSIKAIKKSLGKKPKGKETKKYFELLEPYFKQAGYNRLSLIRRIIEERNFCAY